MKMKFLFLTLLAATALGKRPVHGERKLTVDTRKAHKMSLGTMFRQYVKDFDKEYESADHAAEAYENFRESLMEIRELNAMEGDAVFGLTKFSDMSKADFKATYLGFKPEAGNREPLDLLNVLSPPEGFEAPDAKDWRTLGAVTKVKDQGQCGSCWAFSITEEVESTWFLAGNKLEEFAPQEIVSCDKKDAGCNGGDTISGYKFVEKNGGLPDESKDPYKSGTSGRTGVCKRVAPDGGSISGYTYATPGCSNNNCKNQNEDLLASNLAATAPVSICVNAEKWQHYKSGVMASRHCGKNGYNDLDHCVQLVGYDKSKDGGYWLVRNSWNTDWGEEGYIRLSYGENTCGVADEATITTIKKNE